MKLPSTPTISVVDKLNDTYFNRLWNDPDQNGRGNIALYKASDRVSTGAIPVGLSVVGLPTTDSVYAVYRTGTRAIDRFIDVPTDSWIKDTDITANMGITIFAYAASGRSTPEGSVYLRWTPDHKEFLVAVKGPYVAKCIGDIYPDLYLTVYRDTTRNTPIMSHLYTVSQFINQGTPAATVIQDINGLKASYPKGTIVFVNGWAYDPNHVPSLANGDIVNIIVDPDIIDYIDITVDDNLTGYHSDLYQEYREILHIPKAINPLNKIITNDTLTGIVFDAQTNKGVLAHRLNVHAIESITHNDFSIGRSTLQAFSQSLNAQNITFRLYVRFSIDTNILSDDVNHLSDLYALPDAQIVNQLLGLATPQINEWKASALEQSPFLNLIYTSGSHSTQTVIDDYVSAMGYYEVAATVGEQKRHYIYKGAQVAITKPARLYSYDCYAIVYANGVKVPEGKYLIYDYSFDSFLLGYTLDSNVNVGDDITVYVIESGFRNPIPYNPTALNPSINLDSDDYSVYQIFHYDQNQPVWGRNTNQGFRELPLGLANYTFTANDDGSFDLRVADRFFGQSFYVIPKFGTLTNVYDLKPFVQNKKPIIIDLMVYDVDSNLVAEMGYETLEVYLNGYRLIEGVDYKVSPILGPNGDILQLLMAVSNYDFIDFTGVFNVLEVVEHGDKIVSEDKGYVISNQLHRNDIPTIFHNASTRVFVKGVLQNNVSSSGNIITTNNNVKDGSPFLIQHTLSYGALKLLKQHSPNQDINLRGRIDHVLGIIPPQYPDHVLIDHLYALYSPFLAQIVTDVGRGNFVICDEIKDDRFIKQFSIYKPLFDRDPLLGPNNPLLDRRFVSLAAHYANYTVSDPVQMVRVQRLISLLLTPSDLSIEEVLI